MNRETAALITAAKIRLYKKLYPDMIIDDEYEGKLFRGKHEDIRDRGGFITWKL